MMASHAEVLIGRPAESWLETCAALSLPARVARVVAVHDLPLAIRCTGGCVWITQEGDRRDYVLYPGERFEASSRRDLVVFALEPSGVVVET